MEEDKKELPEEDYKKEDVDSEEAGEESVGGLDQGEVEKPGLIRKMFRKVKTFFKGLGK